MKEYDLNIRELWWVVKKRKFIILSTIIIMGLISFTFTITQAPTELYKAIAGVKVQKTGPVTGLYLEEVASSSTNYMETQAAMIKSYFVMEMAAKRLGFIPADLPSETLRTNSKHLNVILDLKKRVETEQEGNTDIINIIVTSEDPNAARNLANTVAQVYKEEHLLDLNRRTIESKKFIERQVNIVRERTDKTEDAVRQFRESNKLISLDAQSSNLLLEAVKLKAAHDQSMAVYSKISDVIKLFDGNEDKPLPSKTSYYFDVASPTYKSLNDKLANLMLERDTLLLTYTENFPQIQVMNKQIREIMGSMKLELSAQQKLVAANIDGLKKEINEIDGQLQNLPEKGLELARLEREVGVSKEVYLLLQKKYQESLIQEAALIDEIQIVKPAFTPTDPINPPKIQSNTALGVLMGLFLGVVFAFFVETFDTSIAAIEEVEEFLGVSVLGIIHQIDIDEMKATLRDKYPTEVDEKITQRRIKLVSHFVPKSVHAENYRTLRTSLNFKSLEDNTKVILFTSSSPEEGKSTVTSNMAITMAQAGYKVLLVDGDFRKPAVAHLFGINQSPGLTDVILGNYEWKDVCRTITDVMIGEIGIDDTIETPGLDNLHIITSGTIVFNPAEFLSSKSVENFIKQVRAEYDMVLVDASPILVATDAAVWGSKVDGVIMVYQVGRIARGMLKHAKLQLDSVKAKITGVVLNGLSAEISPDFGYADKYYYKYSATKPDQKPTPRGMILSSIGSIAEFLKRYPKRGKRDGGKTPSHPID